MEKKVSLAAGEAVASSIEAVGVGYVRVVGWAVPTIIVTGDQATGAVGTMQDGRGKRDGTESR